MEEKLNLDDIFTGIADAIREKTETIDKIKPVDMAKKIRDIKGGLIQVDSIPENNYDLTCIYEIPHKFDDLFINTKIPGGPNESILFSEMLKGAPIIIAGGEVVNELPTENIIESTPTNGLYFYYSLKNNEVYMYSTDGWMPMSSYFYQMFDGLLMPCKGIINTEFDDVVLGHGYYVVDKKDYYKYFKHWEEITYSGDGSDVIDAGYNLPEKDTNKDRVYKVKYFDDIYLVPEEGKVGYYLNNNLFLICGIDVCETIPTYNPVYPLNSDVNAYQHLYYVKNDDIYLYVNSTSTKGFSPVRITFNAGDESGPIQFKGEVDKNNNVNNTTQGIYAAYTYRYYRNTDSSKQFKYNGKELTATPSTEEQIFEAKGVDYYSKVTVSQVTSDIDSNIAPENIAKDVTILGVTGTLQGGVSTLKKYLDYKKSISGMFSYDSNITFDKLNEIINYDDTSNITDMGSMFSSCSSLTSIPQLNTINATNMNSMFYGCSSLTTIPLLNTGKVTNMERMFYDCSNLTSIPLLNTANNTSMRMMFYECSSLTSIPLLNTAKVTDMYRTFYNCSSLTSIPELNTSKVTNMNGMFSYCSSLTTIPLLKTYHATDMSQMFQSCSSLTEIPLLATYNATNMSSMFGSCSSLTSIPQLNTISATDMNYMFAGCSSLTTIPLLDTVSVTNMSGMFRDCINLTTIPQLDTRKVTNMSYMFRDCASLTTIPLLNTASTTSMSMMFYNCSNLTTIPQLNTGKVTDMSYMFRDCASLTSIPQLDTTNVTKMEEMFYGCWNLTKVDLTYMKITSMYYSSNMLCNCYSLTKLIIRHMPSVPTLHSEAFLNCYHFTGTVNETYNPNGSKDGRIYVPDNMVNTLKSATNWSKYANIIVPLSTLKE